MEKCRLCLKHSKLNKCIFDKANDEGITYAIMINSIANVKVTKCDGMTTKICLACRQNIKKCWNFKLQIERSHMALQKSPFIKRIYFSNLQESEHLKEIIGDYHKKPVSVDLKKNFINKNRNKSFNYNNTVIKKVQLAEKKSISMIELFNSMKDESDTDYQDGYSYEADIEYDPDDYYTDHKRHQPLLKRSTRRNKRIQYNLDVDDDEMDMPLKQRIARDNKQNDHDSSDAEFQLSHKKLTKENKSVEWRRNEVDLKRQPKHHVKNKKNRIVLSNPIKPVFLKDYLLVPQRKKTNSDNKRTKLSRICPYCGKITKYLEVHLNTHADEKLFKCDKCTGSFNSAKILQAHMKNVHGPKILSCDHCVAVFSTKGRLESHMRSHSSEKKYVCDICNKTFKYRCGVQRHVKEIHNLGPKPVKCVLCPDTFHGPLGLKNHMRVHTGERPYRCEICSQPYSYKHDFNRHCLKKHGVWFKRRTVYVMNEEVLAQERILMRDLLLRINGIHQDEKPVNPFEGPQAAMAFDLMIKAIRSGKLVVDLNL